MSTYLVFCGVVTICCINAQTLDASSCRDKIDDCVQYGISMCKTYQPWARENCPAYCGFCIGPPTTPLPCVDKIDDCQDYGRQVCNDPKYAPWVLENCRFFCRQCTDGQLAIAYLKTTLLPSPPCVDNIDDCSSYRADVCIQFEPWAQDHCRYYCRFCTR